MKFTNTKRAESVVRIAVDWSLRSDIGEVIKTIVADEAVLSTGERGVRPCKFVELRRTDNFTVTVRKGGYAPQTVRVRSEASGTGATAMAGNFILGGIIGAGVDAVTGS